MKWLTWKTDEIKSIQILRAIAALSVVNVHATGAKDYNLLYFGSFGVDIFFVISGFVIAFVITKDTSHFMLKRFFRICPMYYLATLVAAVSLFVFPQLINNEVSLSVVGFIKSLLFIPSAENGGKPVLGVGWTLQFEMFFYLVMYISLLLLRNKKYAPYLCIVLILLYLGVAQVIRPNNYALKYFNNDLMLEFVYGVILFKCYEYVKTKNLNINSVAKIIMSAIGAISCYGFMIFINSNQLYVTYRCVYFGLPSLLFVISLLALEKNMKDTNWTRVFVKIGEASYIMYLLHYHIVLFFSRVIFNKLIGPNSIFILELFKLIIAFIAVIVISVILHEFVDNPIQKRLKKLLKRKKTVETLAVPL